MPGQSWAADKDFISPSPLVRKQLRDASMNYQDRWRVLERMMTELRRRQIKIPKETMTSLKSAKTMISISAAESTHSASILSIEEHLLTVESTLFDLAEKVGRWSISLPWRGD